MARFLVFSFKITDFVNAISSKRCGGLAGGTQHLSPRSCLMPPCVQSFNRHPEVKANGRDRCASDNLSGESECMKFVGRAIPLSLCLT